MKHMQNQTHFSRIRRGSSPPDTELREAYNGWMENLRSIETDPDAAPNNRFVEPVASTEALPRSDKAPHDENK